MRLEKLMNTIKDFACAGGIYLRMGYPLPLPLDSKDPFTGTHRLTAIIDASWKVDEYYKGLCMRRQD